MAANRQRTITQTIRPIDQVAPSLVVELFGDWERAGKLISSLEPAMRIGGKLGQAAVAKKIYTLVRKRIRSNGEGTWRNSQSYELWKEKQKPSSSGKIYRLTGTYYKNIEVYTKDLNYYVGLKPRKFAVDIQGRTKGITLHQIAQILEYGNHEISAKPLWGPVRKQMGNTQIRSIILWHIRKQIRLMSGV